MRKYIACLAMPCFAWLVFGAVPYQACVFAEDAPAGKGAHHDQSHLPAEAPEKAGGHHPPAEGKAHGEPAHGNAPHGNAHGDDAHGAPAGPITATQQDVDLALWTLVVFAAFVAVLKKYAWGPLSEGLDKREMGILQNISEAEAARIKAEKMLAAHAEKLDKVQDEVREILAEARRDAEHAKNEIVGAAQKEAEANRQRAIQEIERARDQAIADLFAHMSEAVADATEQVVGRSLTRDDHDRLIREALSGFGPRQN